MRQALLGSLALIGSIGAAAACGAHSSADPVTLDDAGAFATDDGGGASDGINLTGIGAGTGANTGLPCDVQQLLENRCIGCHAGASPPALLTYANLLAPSASDPTKTMAVKCVERLKSTTSPMPPPPAVAPTAAEVSTFEAWVTAGSPMGVACTDGAGAAVDAGAGVDAGTTNYNTAPICTSNRTWNKGNHGSPDMQPGGACLTCHSIRGGPSFVVGGTVYPTAHEPNECNGVNGGLTVIVTDKNGVVTNVPVNTVGNFFVSAAIAAPFHVKVTDGTRTRSMAGSLTAGDCNSCHTETGANGAPGRVMAP